MKETILGEKLQLCIKEEEKMHSPRKKITVIMETELVRPCVKEENMVIPSVPPGFESFTSFTLKRVENKEMTTCSASGRASESQTIQMETEFKSSDNAKMTRSLRRRAESLSKTLPSENGYLWVYRVWYLPKEILGTGHCKMASGRGLQA